MRGVLSTIHSAAHDPMPDCLWGFAQWLRDFYPNDQYPETYGEFLEVLDHINAVCDGNDDRETPDKEYLVRRLADFETLCAMLTEGVLRYDEIAGQQLGYRDANALQLALADLACVKETILRSSNKTIRNVLRRRLRHLLGLTKEASDSPDEARHPETPTGDGKQLAAAAR